MGKSNRTQTFNNMTWAQHLCLNLGSRLEQGQAAFSVNSAFALRLRGQNSLPLAGPRPMTNPVQAEDEGGSVGRLSLSQVLDPVGRW